MDVFESVGELLDVYFSEDESLFEMEVFEAEWRREYILLRVLLRRGVFMISRVAGGRDELVVREDEEALTETTTDLSCILWFGGNRNNK